MAIDYAALAAELVAGHPTTGAYNVDDQLAADELNAVNRPVDENLAGIIDYALFERYRTSAGEGIAVSILGRCHIMAKAVVGADVFGDGTLATYTGIGAAAAFIRALQDDGQGTNPVDLTDSRFDTMLNALVTAEIMGAADRTAIKGLGDNKQSRAAELNLGRNVFNKDHVATARAQ